MTIKRNRLQIVSAFLFVALLLLLNLHCQYDYSSPLPGLIDLRLHSISDSSNIPFSALNNFVLKVNQITAVRADLARAPIAADVKALDRKVSIYNTVDFHAEDSSLVIGQSDLPPGDYSGILMQIEPGQFVVLDGYRNIPVAEPDNFDATLAFHAPFHISELGTTQIVLTINLDSSLVKQAEGYLFKPYYYISSIQYK